MSCNTLYLLSPRLCIFIVNNLDLSVHREDSLTVTEGEVAGVKLV